MSHLSQNHFASYLALYILVPIRKLFTETTMFLGTWMPNVFDFRFDKIFKNDALFEPAYFFYRNQPIFLPYLSVLGMLCPV